MKEREAHDGECIPRLLESDAPREHLNFPGGETEHVKEILDFELTEYARNWAADLDDEAGRLAKRADRDPRAAPEDLSRLVRALVGSSALLRGADGVLPVEGIQDDKVRACAIAWAFRLRNAASDAQQLADVLEAAADVLERATGRTDGPGDRPDGTSAPLPA